MENCIVLKKPEIKHTSYGTVRLTADIEEPGNWTSKRDIFTILQFISKGRLDTKSIISEYVSPKNAEDVYKRLLNDRDFPLGVIFDWTKI